MIDPPAGGEGSRRAGAVAPNYQKWVRTGPTGCQMTGIFREMDAAATHSEQTGGWLQWPLVAARLLARIPDSKIVDSATRVAKRAGIVLEKRLMLSEVRRVVGAQSCSTWWRPASVTHGSHSRPASVTYTWVTQ
eukprot:2047454-Pyramimonas_sp.AAC.2